MEEVEKLLIDYYEKNTIDYIINLNENFNLNNYH